MKLIKDTIHGYIKVPEDYCRYLIDTEVFQRLRRIEQTSIRSIFPCAHHDRFVHSLGTYHLGSKAINEVFRNSIDVIKEIEKENKFDKNWKEIIKSTFEIACLLHDCGQAPFSHTFEFHYDRANVFPALLINHSDDEDLKDDIIDFPSKPHEKVSAYLVLTFFKERISKINEKIDVNFIARMIIGCKYKNNFSPINQLKNCLIELLNGDIIDVDKLDYTARDRWASGYNASTVDTDRLLSSLQICKRNDNYVLCIRKNAVSEIDGLVDSANFQSFWIFNHHKVVYEQHLLEEALNLLTKSLNPGNPDSVFKQMFNVNVITKKQNINGHFVYQLTDDDIIYLLKQYHDKNPYFQEWVSREYKLKPLWKSYTEYCKIFTDKMSIKEDSPERLRERVKKAVKGVLEKSGFKKDSFYIGTVKGNLKQVSKNELLIKIDDNTTNGIIDYFSLGINKRADNVKPYFYVYVKKECFVLKNSIIEKIKTELSS
jgi:HD superfamily phosphohydrolase